MSPELLSQFGLERKEEEEERAFIIKEKTGEKMQEGLFSKLQKKFLCSKYNVQIKDWLKFYVKVMFTGEMKVVNN